MADCQMTIISHSTQIKLLLVAPHAPTLQSSRQAHNTHTQMYFRNKFETSGGWRHTALHILEVQLEIHSGRGNMKPKKSYFSFIPLSKIRNLWHIDLLKKRYHGTYQHAQISEFSHKYFLSLPISQITFFSQVMKYKGYRKLYPSCDSVISIYCLFPLICFRYLWWYWKYLQNLPICIIYIICSGKILKQSYLRSVREHKI